MTELLNHEAVYRTAPATPGLLITLQTGRTILVVICSCAVVLIWLALVFSSTPASNVKCIKTSLKKLAMFFGIHPT